jgi:hypothetical protein
LRLHRLVHVVALTRLSGHSVGDWCFSGLFALVAVCRFGLRFLRRRSRLQRDLRLYAEGRTFDRALEAYRSDLPLYAL